MRVSQYANKEKIICGLLYNSNEYDFEFVGAKTKKLRITTIIDNIIYQFWTCTQTWKNASENKQSSFNPESWRFKKNAKKIGTLEETKNKIIETMNKPSSLLPMVYNPIRKNFFGVTDNESLVYMFDKLGDCADDDKAIRRTYKQFAKLYHPDYLGRELFLDEIVVLEVLKETKEQLLMNYRDMMEVLSDLED